MVDRTLVLRKLADLDEYGGQIAEYAEVTADRYRADWKVQRIVERTLQVMIETCLDIAGHIIADEGLRVPDSYADMFRILQEKGVLGEELGPAMEQMARFRNLVVHQYQKLDPVIVVTILNRHLSDFDRFRQAIVAWLKGLAV
jgi:uncharacterized protein YutE (UPF0331/DUF86 family)